MGEKQAIVRSDWMLVSSRTESISIVFSNIMKLKRPLLVMPVGNLLVLIRNGQCGLLLVQSINTEGYVAGLCGLLANQIGKFFSGVHQQAEVCGLAKLTTGVLQETLAHE